MGSSLHGNTKGNVLQRVALEEVEMVRLGSVHLHGIRKERLQNNSKIKKSL